MELVVRKAAAADAPVLAWLRWRWEEKPDSSDRAAFMARFSAWVVEHLPTQRLYPHPD